MIHLRKKLCLKSRPTASHHSQHNGLAGCGAYQDLGFDGSILEWTILNYLGLNALKSVELVVDFGKNCSRPQPHHLDWLFSQHSEVLPILRYNNNNNNNLAPQVGAEHQRHHQKAQQRMHFLWLRIDSKTVVVNFYSAIIEPILLLLLLHLVRCRRHQGQTAEYHSLYREGDWLQFAIPPGPACPQHPEVS